MKSYCQDCCSPAMINSKACGCCEGTELITPQSIANRPGLPQLACRIGTHAGFLETMKARLSEIEFPELDRLSTREGNDPSIALLDAWATVADVLSFYQERIANEGYLRTATERRSILELGRLVGYALRPGVSSSVFLGYTIEDTTKEEVVIPAGSRVQSVPGPDELPQTFETGEDLTARAEWNNLRPRMAQPQTETTIRTGTKDSLILGPRVYLKGINTNLKPNDRLFIDFHADTPEVKPELFRVTEVTPDAKADHTIVMLMSEEDTDAGNSTSTTTSNGALAIRKKPDRARLDLHFDKKKFLIPEIDISSWKRITKHTLAPTTGLGYSTFSNITPSHGNTFISAVSNAEVRSGEEIKVYKFQVKSNLFGHNVPRRTTIPEAGGVITDGGDWPIIERGAKKQLVRHEEEEKIYLDKAYESIQTDTWMVIQTQETDRLTKKGNHLVKVLDVDAVQHRSKYGISSPSTCIEINYLNRTNKWIDLKGKTPLAELSNGEKNDFDVLRSTTVYAQPEEIELAEEPVEEAVEGDLIELDGFCNDLYAGHKVIISGERVILGTSGVEFSELATLSSVEQKTKPELPVDKTHTFIQLNRDLTASYKRDTVKIYGNIVKATHGETREEVLGSGDSSTALQSFALKQKPLTYVSASNPTGVESTLKVFVNDVRWHEAETLADRKPTDRNFITKTDDENITNIQFGNGKKGMRLPTGLENIKAVYRSGMGKQGNVKSGQISLLLDKPLGVKEVINPLRASGGADREGCDQGRKNAPIAVKALDRLVSVQDYEDFSRTYTGIGKARAAELTNGRRQLVHVTIAGTDNIPIDEYSDLFLNLHRALHAFGDPHQSIHLAVRELMLIVISADIRILPDYQWEPVEAQLRKAMLDTFSFERQELGQDVLLSEVFRSMQSVPGVAYVDVNTFGGIPEKIKGDSQGDERRPLLPDEIAEAVSWLSRKIPISEGSEKKRLLTSDEIAEAVWCNSYQCSDTDEKCTKPSECDLYKTFEEAKRVRQRIEVNLAAFDNAMIRPAQLAFLTPDVPETLILNQI